MAEIYDGLNYRVMPNIRTLRLVFHFMDDMDTINEYIRLGIPDIPLSTKYMGLYYQWYTPILWGVSSGEARALNYRLRYRQLKKIYRAYLSLGKSSYYHISNIGNTKQIYSMQNQGYTYKRSECINLSIKRYMVRFVFRLYDDNTKYHTYKAGIIKLYDRHREQKLAEYYGKCNIPLHCAYGSKTDYFSAITMRPIRDYKSVAATVSVVDVLDKFTFKPVRMPSSNIVKGVVY